MVFDVMIRPVPEPLYVHLSQPGSALTEWGPIIGVVIGALLTAGLQIGAARLQRGHERAAENRAEMRKLYPRALAVLDAARTEAWDRRVASRQTTDEASRAARYDGYTDQVEALLRAAIELSIGGSRRVALVYLDLAETITQAVLAQAPLQRSGQDESDDWGTVYDLLRQGRTALAGYMRADVFDHHQATVWAGLADQARTWLRSRRRGQGKATSPER